jgi:hypothetical protein
VEYDELPLREELLLPLRDEDDEEPLPFLEVEDPLLE